VTTLTPQDDSPLWSFFVDIGDIKLFRKRWQAVSEVALAELQASSVEQNWTRLNAIRRRAVRLGITRGDDDGEMEVFLRWAKLKAKA
jgi:hypothetical protein